MLSTYVGDQGGLVYVGYQGGLVYVGRQGGLVQFSLQLTFLKTKDPSSQATGRCVASNVFTNDGSERSRSITLHL